MKQGWIKLHRQLQDHWLWGSSGELSKLEAWLDICLSCNHSEQKVNIKNQLITVKCGESVQSLTTWSKRWSWNKSKVVRFLELLEKDGMIESIPCSKTKHIRVCNYATYQHEQNADETQTKRKRNASETKTKTNKNDKNDKNEKKEETPPPKGSYSKKSGYQIEPEVMARWKASYPNIDISLQLNKAHEWLIQHDWKQKNGKPYKSMSAFATNWLNRQDKEAKPKTQYGKL